MSHTIYTCDKCGFEATSRNAAGSFVYINREICDSIELVVGERDLGWCFNCNDFVPVEKFPSKSEIRKTQEIHETQLELLTRKSFLFKLSSKYKENVNYREEQIKKQHFWLEFLNKRQSPPRCFRCESTEIKIINEETDYVHPGCGGKFKLSHWEGCIMATYKKRMYSWEGRLADE